MSQKSSSPAARSAVSELPEIPEGEIIGGHYRIQELLARGSSGVVYRAHHQLLGEDIALKLFGNPDSVDNLMAEYVDEYKAQQKIADRTHILNTEAPFTFQWGGLHWLGLPMQLAEMSLRKWMRQADLEDEQVFQQSLTYVHQACLGVEAIHKAGLLHLDLKPENLLLLPTGDQENPYTVKVADFGLARTLGKQEQRSSLFGDGIGTPAYMAPEQIKAAHWKDVGKPADIYGLGMILYELLDGDLPYSGSAQQIRQKKLDASIKIRRPEGQPDLTELAMECLQREASQRKGSTEAVAEQLRQGLDGYREWEANKAKVEQLLKQAQAAFDKGELEEAKDKLEELGVLAPNHEQAEKLLEQVENQIKELEKERERKQKEERKQKAEHLYDQAQLSFDSGELEAAKDKLKECLELVPNHQKTPELLKKVVTRIEQIKSEKELKKKEDRKENERKKKIIEEFLNECNFSSINDTDKYGKTPLHEAAKKGKLETVQLLLNAGADLDAKCKYEETALHVASEEGNIEIIKILINLDANIYAENMPVTRPIEFPVMSSLTGKARDKVEIIKLFLSSGYKIDKETSKNDALINSVGKAWPVFLGEDFNVRHDCNERIRVLKFLLENGSEINHQGEDGYTALHSITGDIGYDKLISALIDSGSDLKIRTDQGKRPIDCLENLIKHKYDYIKKCQDEIKKHSDNRLLKETNQQTIDQIYKEINVLKDRRRVLKPKLFF